jgi:indole-3-glycerol phosphate synthase
MAVERSGSVLDEIVAARRQHVESAKSAVSIERMALRAGARQEHRDFAGVLRAPGLQVIAELKWASPSRGLIRPDYPCREIALGYKAAGAAALSVLTEEKYFRGELAHLSEVREAVDLPILRKDFIVDEYQVYESVAGGADALLLIVAALTLAELQSLLELSRRLSIAALVEIHTEEDLVRARDVGAEIIGINNRDLRTLEVNLETSLRLRRSIPTGAVAVSESGLKTSRDLRRMAEAGFDAVLVGERLMSAPEPGRELARLLKGVRTAAEGSR